MRRHLLVVVAAFATLLVAACDDAADPSSAPTGTPDAIETAERTSPSLTPSPDATDEMALPGLAGPFPPSDAFAGDRADDLWLLYDLETRQVYFIRDAEAERVGSLRWVDGRLEARTPGGLFALGLDGSVTALDEPPSPTPRTGIPGLARETSPDGAWTYAEDIDPLGLGVFAEGGPRYRILSAVDATWSPQGHLLAMHVDVCRGEHIAVFNPDTAELIRLRDAIDGSTLDYSWRPNGRHLAVDVVPFEPRERRRLDLYDIETRSAETLLDVVVEGDLAPRSWSPDGRYLVVLQFPGRDFCDVPEAFIPPPTTVERVDQ
jgi:hypothetical protein